MKIIFLDIDGVLNGFEDYTAPTMPTHTWTPDLLHKCGIKLETFPHLIERVNRLIEHTEAKIVLSSSWRKGNTEWWNQLVSTLGNMGLLPVIIDRTPSLYTNRGIEIQDWLSKHPEVTHFVILDDINEMENLLDNFVQTDYQVGIQDSDIEKAEKILGL